MIRGTQLLTFVEHSQNELASARIVEQLGSRRLVNPQTGKAVETFKERWYRNLGIVDTGNGLKIDRQNRSLDAKEVSFQEVAMTFLGRHLGQTELFEACQYRNTRLREGEGGGVVLPSALAHVGAFSDTISGLVDALILEAFDGVEFIGNQVTTPEDARVNGGKAIGARGEGGESEPLLDGEAAPMNGIKETYVQVPDNYRFAEAVALNSKTFLYDRTGQAQEACEMVGTKVGRAKEGDIADTVMGITNNFSQDGKTSNTYKDTAGDLPVNYVNAGDNELNSWTDINDAIQTLARNRDPHTGYEITLKKPFDVLVSPSREMLTNTILRAVTIRQATSSTLDEVRYGPNPLPPFNILSSMIWYNRMVASAGTDEGTQRWWMGNFKKAFKYRTISPFGVQDDPTEVSIRKDIMMCRVASIWGRAYVVNPRYAYRGEAEA